MKQKRTCFVNVKSLGIWKCISFLHIFRMLGNTQFMITKILDDKNIGINDIRKNTAQMFQNKKLFTILRFLEKQEVI
jgi:hypothetical protein